MARSAKLRSAVAEVTKAVPMGRRVVVLQSISAFQCDLDGKGIWPLIAKSYECVDRLGLHADLYTDRSLILNRPRLDPASVPVIVDSAAPVLCAEASDSLAAYVHAGGVLIVHASTGRYTAGRPDERFRLLNAIGYAGGAEESAAARGDRAIGDDWLSGKAAQIRNVAPISPLPTGATVLARFPDGSAATAIWPCGKGNVILLGGTPNYDDAGTRVFLEAILAHFGIEPAATATGNIGAAALERGGVKYVALWNPSNAPVQTTVTLRGVGGAVRAYDLVGRRQLQGVGLNGRTVTVDITLDPLEVTAIAFDSASASPRKFGPLDYPERGEP